MTVGSKKKHDETIDNLVKRLDPDKYHQISKNVEYYNPGCKGVAGEIDAMAFKLTPNKTYLLLFEMKCTDTAKNYNKALKQLTRSEKHYQKFADKIYMFYVTPGEGENVNIELM